MNVTREDMACAARRATKVHEFVAHGAVVNCISIGRKSGKVVATAGDDKKVNLWTVPRYNCVLRLHGHTTPIDTVKFNQSEDLLASGSNSGAVKLFDLEAAKVLRTLNGHKASIRCIDFHPYGDFIASGSCDNTIKLWDSRKRSCINTYRGHDQKVNSIRFSPDGRWIVSGGDDGSVKLWDLAMGKMIHQFKDHKAAVNDVEFHPNEFLLATGSEDGSVKFYDLETYSLISSTNHESGSVHCTRFHPDGEVMVCGSDDVMRVYSWEPAVNNFDTVVMGWGRVDDIMVGKENIVAASKSVTNVCLYVLETNKVQPFAPASAFIDSAPVRSANSFRRSSPLGSNPRRSFNTKTRSKLDVAYKREINSSEASDNSYDSYEPSSTDDVSIMEPATYTEIFHPSKELSRSPPRDSFPVMSSTGGMFKLPPIKDALPSPPKQHSPPRVDPVLSRNLASSDCLKSITAGNRVVVSHTTSTSTATSQLNTNTTNTATNVNANNYSNMRSSFSMGNLKENGNHHGSLSSSSSTLSSLSTSDQRKTGTANSSSSGDLSPIQPASEPSTPIKTQIFLPRRALPDKTNSTSEQSLVSIVKPVMSVKAAAVVHPEVVTAVPPRVEPVVSVSRENNINLGNNNNNSYNNNAPGGLNFDDFLPAHVQSISRGPMTPVLSETEAVEKISSGHNSMKLAMVHRLGGLRLIHSKWNPKDPRAAVEAALNLKDASVLVDLINVIVLRPGLWNLDLCQLLLPTIYELIQSKYESRMSAAISAIKLILKNFGSTIKETVSGPRAVGVDIMREERFSKCNGCYDSLIGIRSFLLKRQTMQGKVGTQFRDLQTLMEVLD